MFYEKDCWPTFAGFTGFNWRLHQLFVNIFYEKNCWPTFAGHCHLLAATQIVQVVVGPVYLAICVAFFCVVLLQKNLLLSVWCWFVVKLKVKSGQRTLNLLTYKCLILRKSIQFSKIPKYLAEYQNSSGWYGRFAFIKRPSGQEVLQNTFPLNKRYHSFWVALNSQGEAQCFTHKSVTE